MVNENIKENNFRDVIDLQRRNLEHDTWHNQNV